MNESRIQALDRLLANLEKFDVTSPVYEDEEAVIQDVTAMLYPFLQNPERHQEHIKIILEYATTQAIARAVNPILKIYKYPIIRSFVSFPDEGLKKFREKALQAREDLLSSVDPGQLDIDLLPITTLQTKADWKKQKKRLILIETRAVTHPTLGMKLQAISHRIEIKNPAGCQFIDSTPTTEMELIGQRKSTVTDRGKFVHSVSSDATLKSSLKGGPANLESSLVAKDSETIESESSDTEELSHASHVARVISSAVGTTALWELLRTPTQTLLGSNNFSATVLVPAEIKTIELLINYSANIEGWGPTSITKNFKAEIPAAKTI